MKTLDRIATLALAFSLALPLHAVEIISLTRTPTSLEKVPTNVSVITAKDIEQAGSKSLADALDQIPSVDIGRSGALGSLASVRLRGVTSSNQVQILIDDQPIGGASTGFNDISLISVQDVDRIEVLRGGSGVIYGANTIGGVINIITKKNKRDQVTAETSVEAGSHQTIIGSGQAGAPMGPLKTYFTLGGYETDGYQNNSHADQFTGTGNVGYHFGNGALVEASGDRSTLKSGNPNGTPTRFEEWDGEKERKANSLDQRIERTLSNGRLKAVIPLFANMQITSLSYHSMDNYKFLGAPNDTPIGAYQQFVTGNDTRLTFANGFSVGGSYERDERNSLGQSDHHITNMGGYVQDEFNISKVTLYPAVRYDHHSTFGHEWNPRLAVVYTPIDRLKLSATGARAFHAPTLSDLYDSFPDPFGFGFDFFPNPNLKPEIARTYDAGAELRVFDQTTIGVTGFYTNIKNRMSAVDTNNNAATDIVVNTSRAEIFGAEAAVHTVTGPLVHDANYTLTKAQGQRLGETHFIPLRLTPMHAVNYRLTFHATKSLDIINTVQYVSHQFQTDDRRGLRLAPYTLWNARVEQNIKWFQVFAEVRNITDRLYGESIGSGATFGVSNPVPQPGRTYWGGVKVKFGERE